MSNPTTVRRSYLRVTGLALALAFAGTAVPAALHAQSAPAVARPVAPTNGAVAMVGPTGPVANTPVVPQTEAIVDANAVGRAFTEVADRVLPSVVSIRVEAEAEEGSGMGSMPGFPPGMVPFGMNPPGTEGGAPRHVRGEGSGVIVRPDGVILTNNHVVERSVRLMVHLRDGRVMRGRVLGTDPATDLALVKIDANNLPSARLGDSDQARVGEWVLAIGAPLGLEATVTHGVVSATGRGNIGANELEDYLQTDASINPGNSGGPLVNLRGEVLGINTMIIGRNTGIGLSVPSRMAMSVVEQILRNGRVSRGWLGVGVQDMTAELASSMGMGPGVRGALVNNVDAAGPAARAGLSVGDVVTSIDGRAVQSSHELVRGITRHAAGEPVTLAVMGERGVRTVSAMTLERPGHGPNANGPVTAPVPVAPRAPGLGLRLSAMTPDLAMRVGAPAGALIVAGVEPGSPADEAGLRRGDVILRADNRPVRTSPELEAAARDGRLSLLVRRGQGQLFVPVSMD